MALTTMGQQVQDIAVKGVELLVQALQDVIPLMQDFVDAIFPGGGIILFTGVEYYSFEMTFESIFLGDLNEKFIIVAEIPEAAPFFEYDFEFEFTGATDNEKLRCVLEKIIPA